MEIHPGLGLDDVTLGAVRVEVRQRLGTPRSADDHSDYYANLVIRYDTADTAELIEVTYGGLRGEEVTLRGVQLTPRPMDEVVLDLHSLGLTSRPSDIGYDFAAGFAIWSMGSLEVSETGAPTSERLVVEGVSVGTPRYFGFEA